MEAHRGEGLQHEMEELDAVRAEHGVRRWFHFVFFFKFFKDFFFMLGIPCIKPEPPREKKNKRKKKRLVAEISSKN